MDNYSKINISKKSIEKNFAVLSFNDEADIDEEKINIINNSGENLLHAEVENIEGKINILYDITDKITIEEYLKEKILMVSEFSNILLKILKELKKIDSTKLRGFCLVDSRSIYIDKYLQAPHFICIPTKAHEEAELDSEFLRFTKKLIVDVVEIDDRENFISKVLNFLRKKAFSISEFEEFLNEYAQDKALNQDENELKKEKIFNVEADKKEPAIKKTYGTSKELNPKTEIIASNEKKVEDKENKYVEDIIRAQKNKIGIINAKYILLIFVLQFIAASGVIFVVLFFKDEGYLIKSILISVFLGIDLILTLLLILTLSNKKNAYKVKVASKSTENIRNITASNTNNIKMSKREIVSEMSYSTQIIGEEYPYLAQNENGVVQKIYINKSSFKIGRLPEFVDYVSDNKAVGKMHAEIRKINSEYYIMDLNSKNGTYINDKKLESNELYKIKENDSIKLANSSYVFRFN